MNRSKNFFQNSLIVGDAAHAIVPFYGQGMNAGMEDIAVLLDTYEAEGNLKKAIEKVGQTRPADAHAIADFALYNYIEMRDLVRRYESFLIFHQRNTKWNFTMIYVVWPFADVS